MRGSANKFHSKMYVFGSFRATEIRPWLLMREQSGTAICSVAALDAREAAPEKPPVGSPSQVDFLPFVAYLEAAMRMLPVPKGFSQRNVNGIE